MWLIGKQIEDDSSPSALCTTCFPTFWAKVLRTGSPTREQPKALSACPLAPWTRNLNGIGGIGQLTLSESWHTVSVHAQCNSSQLTARFPASANMHLFNLQDPKWCCHTLMSENCRDILCNDMQRHDPPAALRYLSLKFKLWMMRQTSISNLWWLFEGIYSSIYHQWQNTTEFDGLERKCFQAKGPAAPNVSTSCGMSQAQLNQCSNFTLVEDPSWMMLAVSCSFSMDPSLSNNFLVSGWLPQTWSYARCAHGHAKAGRHHFPKLLIITCRVAITFQLSLQTFHSSGGERCEGSTSCSEVHREGCPVAFLFAARIQCLVKMRLWKIRQNENHYICANDRLTWFWRVG